MNGLGLNDLKLVPPEKEWGTTFLHEKKRLLAVPQTVAVEHIGSTCIPGIKAKPVVDIAMAVASAPDDERLKQALLALGYEARGEYGLPGRQFFTWGQPPVIHLHVVAANAPHWRDWLDFRDYLLAHPVHARAYEQEKIRLAEKYAGDRAAYTKSKGEFILHTLALARG